MKIVRLGPKGAEIPAVLVDPPDGGQQQRWFDLRPLTRDIDGDFLADDGLARTAAAVAAGELNELEGAPEMRNGTPIARPGSIVCIGMNYAAHAAESGAATPTIPVVFLKPSNTASGPDDDVPLPPGAEQYDWEVELAIVIGRETSYASSIHEAGESIAGYMVANDLSERRYQLDNPPAGQWTKGKSLPYSTPLGPWLVPASDLDADRLNLRSWVNGEPRQDSTTADLVFDPATIVHHCSQYMLLEPGDVILTGTPEGVALSGRFPYLRDGDTMDLEIEGLGRQHQRVRSAGPGAENTTYQEASA